MGLCVSLRMCVCDCVVWECLRECEHLYKRVLVV